MIRLASSLFLAGIISLGLTAGVLAQDDDEDTSLSRTEDALENIIQEALDEGYITLRSDTEDAAEPEEAPAPAPVVQQAPAGPGKLSVPAYRDIGTILQESGYESLSPSQPQAVVAAEPEVTCADQDLFDFKEDNYSWDRTSAMQAGIAGRASAPGLEESILLAKNYLALGLAEEAMALMRSHVDEYRAQIVYDMAETVAGKISDANALKYKDAICTGKGNVWRAVALTDVQPKEALFLAETVTEDVVALPQNLRADFAIRLGVLAAENNRWGLATTYHDIAATSAEPESRSMIYLRALLNAHNNVDRDRALSTIERIAQQEGDLQVNAMLMLGKVQPEVEGEYYPGYFRDLETVTLRSNPAPQSFPEAYMEVRLAAETGDYMRALSIASTYRYPTEADYKTMREGLTGLLETGLSRSSKPTRFVALNAYLEKENFFTGAEHADDLNIAGARAALDLGLPDIAVRLIETLNGEAMTAETERLLAQAYLADGQYEDVVRLAYGAEDEAMRKLAATALDRGGNSREALAQLAGVTPSEAIYQRKADIALRAEDWAEARNAYADLMVGNDNVTLSAYHTLAGYMAGRDSALEPLPDAAGMEALEFMISTHTEEIELLWEVMSNG